MGLSCDHKEWLLAMVDEFKLHPRVAKLRGKTAEHEWEMLDRMVSEEILRREEQEDKEGAP